MRRKFILTLLFLVAAVFISNDVFAAWTQAKGHSYNQLTIGYNKSTTKTTTIEFYPADWSEESLQNKVRTTDAESEKVGQAEFAKTSVTYYGEFGVMEDLTAIVSVPHEWINSADVRTFGNSGPTGIGDINLGLRRKISNNIGGGILASFEVTVKVPEAYDYEDPLTHTSMGDGQYDYSGKIKFGKGFSKGYTVVDIGYKYRDYNDELGDDFDFKPSDNWFVSISGGYNATSWLSIRGKVDWSKAIGNAKVSNGMLARYSQINEERQSVAESMIILDAIGLEKNNLSAGFALAFTLAPKIQTVLSYNKDLEGWGDLSSKNTGLGTTYDIAFVYMY